MVDLSKINTECEGVHVSREWSPKSSRVTTAKEEIVDQVEDDLCCGYLLISHRLVNKAATLKGTGGMSVLSIIYFHSLRPVTYSHC